MNEEGDLEGLIHTIRRGKCYFGSTVNAVRFLFRSIRNLLPSNCHTRVGVACTVAIKAKYFGRYVDDIMQSARKDFIDM